MITPRDLPVEKIAASIERDMVQDPIQSRDSLGAYRCAAVLVPLLIRDGEWQLLFTKRSETLPDHKGQVSFPGGACEVSDRGPAETARRESFEEIGVRPKDIQVIGYLDRLLSVTSFLITPVVATIPWPYPLVPSPYEVDTVFTVPLAWLVDTRHWEEKPFVHPVLGEPQMVVYYQPYEGQTIWGLTARITLSFLQTLKLVDKS
ncbi:MAG TPA: CoA pyrophosphatase [Anaerolineaceae bacterium]|nr:CoA pyrophosphatase [Anaerolineaceae bacterium]